MRKTILILLLTIGISTIYAQTTTSISGLVGFSENGYSGMANLHFYPKRDTGKYFEIGGYASFIEEKETVYEIPIEIYSLNLGYFSEISFLTSQDDSFSISLGVGGVFGEESIDDSEINLSENDFITTEDGIIYGAYGAVEADIKITRNISAIGRYTHFYHANSEIGKSKFMIGLGLAIKL